MRRRVIASGSRRNQTHYDQSCSRFVRRLQEIAGDCRRWPAARISECMLMTSLFWQARQKMQEMAVRADETRLKLMKDEQVTDDP